MRSRGRHGFTLVELVLVLLLLATIAAVFFWIYIRPGLLESRMRSSCASNLKRFAMALHLYASEAPGCLYPPIKATHCDGSTIAGWSGAPDFTLLMPDYFPDLELVARCPGNETSSTALALWDAGENNSVHWKAAFDGGHMQSAHNGVLDPCEVYGEDYTYTGWTLPDAPFAGSLSLDFPNLSTDSFSAFQRNVNLQGAALARSGTEAASAVWTFDEQSRSSFMDHTNAPRLGINVERTLVQDPQNPQQLEAKCANIPVMWDGFWTPWPNVISFMHRLGGGNILYLDGHVEFMQFKGLNQSPFPYNDAGNSIQQAMQTLYE